jgi:hypothetical protein
MTFIKNAWSKVTSFLQYLGILSKAKTLVDGFPGLDDQEKLRSWVIVNAENFQPVVEKTANQIDDRILFEIRRVALNEKAFSAIYNLMRLGYEFVPRDNEEPVYGEVGRAMLKDFTSAIDDEDVGNPLMFISVAGLLLQLILFIRAQRQGK